MYQGFFRKLDGLDRPQILQALARSLVGLEKESLRVAPGGGISQQPHPRGLGSALTHPYITTDYSEALLECITPPMVDRQALWSYLNQIHRFVYGYLGEELLWASSMPCVVEGEQSIPIARYGSSNAGRMKEVYRIGLGYRYGRLMQIISGVHLNYSFDDSFWTELQQLENDGRADFQSTRYFDMIRNIQRYGWLVPYLFGSSPAVCRSFLGGIKTNMAHFDENTLYEPYATSLRMGDIGYQNNREMCAGFKANYDSLLDYVRSLQLATETSCKDYENIGVFVGGQWRQLNSNLLQIENEYYSTIRPKQTVDRFEKPVHALRKRGVQYLELRSLDVNVFEPVGISMEQIYFIEILMLFCLIQDSPLIAEVEKEQIDANFGMIAHHGREPGLELYIMNESRPLQDWTRELLAAMEPVAQLLDEAHQISDYRRVLGQQQQVAADPSLTVSARVLADMRANAEGFYQHTLRISLQHQSHFQSLPSDEEFGRRFRRLAAESLEQQVALEASDRESFDEYLARYFAQ